MSIRIAAIHTEIVNHALRPARIVISPAGRHDESRFLLVRIRDEDGIEGYGECATTAIWSGETAATAQSLIRELFESRLVGEEFQHPREALDVMDRAAFGVPFTKSGLDQAIWDLWAKTQNAGATMFFSDRTPLDSLPTRASVGCYDVPNTVRIATEFWAAGIRNLKFKIGLAGIDDAARLRTVRENLGEAPVFTVDANGGYASADDALRAIEKLVPYAVAVVEQPTPRDRIGMLADVRKRSSVPIMADEAVFSRDDLLEAIDREACDIVSLYPGKNGGITRSIEMAGIARNAGLKCAIGSNLETDLGQAAMIALASAMSAFPADSMICDLPAALFYESSSVRRPIEFNDGRVYRPVGPGFGVEPV